MAYYDTQTHAMLPTDHSMLHEMDNIFTDSMLHSMLESNMPNIHNVGSLHYADHNQHQHQHHQHQQQHHSNNTSTSNTNDDDYSPTLHYTEVFRASDMNTAATCVNGVQHFSSPPLSPPISPDTCHDDSVEGDTDCTSCVKCRETATQKRARRREQNRQSQRKFRARKEAKLSDAKARIRDLEALVKAQEKTNIDLRLTIEELNSRQSAADATARRLTMARSEEQKSVAKSGSDTEAFRTRSMGDRGDSQGSLSQRQRGVEPLSQDTSKKK